MDGKTGLIVAAGAAGVALILGKTAKPAVAACPPGTTRDKASGQCILIKTVEVTVTGPGGDQRNKGGASETAELSYAYNLQMLDLWQEKALQYGDDARINSEYKALMTLIEASSMIGSDTPAGKAAVDMMNTRIQAAFANLDALRKDKAASLVREDWKAGRLELASTYDAATKDASAALTEYTNELKKTFDSARSVVRYYRDKKTRIKNVLRAITDGRALVDSTVYSPSTEPQFNSDKWPTVLLEKLPNEDVFIAAANSLAEIVPPEGAVNGVLDGAPRLTAQIAAIRTNFELFNTWGAIAAGLKNAANPLAATGLKIDYLSALTLGPGVLYCGRAAATLSAINLLAVFEKAINDLEIIARAYAVGYKQARAYASFARGIETTVLSGDGFNDSSSLTRTVLALDRYPGGPGWWPYPQGFPPNTPQQFIKQETSRWLLNRFSLAGSLVLDSKIAGSLPGDVNSIWALFHGWAAPTTDALVAKFDALFDLLVRWELAIGVVSDDGSSPDSSQLKAELDLALIGSCPNEGFPLPALDYKTVMTQPDTSLLMRNASSVKSDTKIVDSASTARAQVTASFAGLSNTACQRGVCGAPNSSRTSIRESDGVPMRSNESLRVSIAERIAIRGSGGGLGQVGRGRVGGLGHLGDPIQSILSPLLGLNGRKRRY